MADFAGLLIFAVSFQLGAKGISQIITLNQKDAFPESIFPGVKKQTRYGFTYESGSLDNTIKITLEVKNALVEQVLKCCFKGQPLTYTIIGKPVAPGKKGAVLTLADGPQVALDSPAIGQ